MADNLDITQGTGTTIGADEISSVKYQRIKIIVGADGTNDGDVCAGNPMPISDAGGSVTVDGTVAVTNADLSTIAGDTTSIDGKITACNTGAVVLASGSAAIGKLAANSGVDIGDVDVTSCALPTGAATESTLGDIKTAVQLIDNTVGAIAGSGSPVIDSYTSAAINVDTGANSTLVAAPGANKQIWVYGLVLLANVAGSFSLQDEDDTALSGIMPIAATGGFCMNPSGNFAMPWIKVATNKALEIDCVTCTADGVITYAIVSV